MRNGNINISAIETHLVSVLEKKVSENCYAGTLPSTLEEDGASYVVVDCGNSINDLHAYGKGIINIYFYAMPVDGLKDVGALSKLETAFQKALNDDAFDNEHYSVARELAYQDTGFDSSYSMHYIIKAIHLTIT